MDDSLEKRLMLERVSNAAKRVAGLDMLANPTWTSSFEEAISSLPLETLEHVAFLFTLLPQPNHSLLYEGAVELMGALEELDETPEKEKAYTIAVSKLQLAIVQINLLAMKL
jgi:hypothetical protein